MGVWRPFKNIQTVKLQRLGHYAENPKDCSNFRLLKDYMLKKSETKFDSSEETDSATIWSQTWSVPYALVSISER